MLIFIPNVPLKHVTKPNFIANSILKIMYNTQMKSVDTARSGREGDFLQQFSGGEHFLMLHMYFTS